jgi:hypothetical protein
MAITDKDVTKLKEVFATKEDLKQFEAQFATKDELRQFRGEVIAVVGALENKTMTRFDRVMGELEKAREDRVFAKAKDDEQDGRLDLTEKRLEKFEARLA